MHTQPDIHMPRGTQTYTWVALISQTGTAAPTQKVLLNTLPKTTIDNIGYWAHDGTGAYSAFATGTDNFDNTKTTIKIGQNGNNQASAYIDNSGQITIKSNDASGTPTDDALQNTTLEITIFN